MPDIARIVPAENVTGRGPRGNGDAPDASDDGGLISGKGVPTQFMEDEKFGGSPRKTALDRSTTLLKLGDLRGATRAAGEEISSHPRNPGGYNLRAFAKILLKDYRGAADDALAATRLDPRSAPGWRNLAFAQLRQGRLHEALESATRAIKINPKDAHGYAIRAYIAQTMGNRRAAAFWMSGAAALHSAFREKDARARAGLSVYDPSDDDRWLLALADGSLREEAPRFPRGWALGCFTILALLIGAFAGIAWRLRRQLGLFAANPVSHGPIPSLAIPRVGGRYELGRIIGRGGMGVVYEATDHALGRTVAVKKMVDTISSDDTWRRRFINEARTVASLRHPAIVQIHDVIEEDSAIYLVFEFVKGKTAQSILAEQGPLSIKQTLDILRPVSEALGFAHSRNLVHRDLKPANIMIGNDGRVRLMDFGLARAVPGAREGSGRGFTQTALGTPCYMSPESDRGVVCREADVYALGVCAYEMLTGFQPFAAYLSSQAKEAMNFEPASFRRRDLPAEVDDLIVRALQPDPARRLKRPSDLIAGLAAAARSAEMITPV